MSRAAHRCPSHQRARPRRFRSADGLEGGRASGGLARFPRIVSGAALARGVARGVCTSDGASLAGRRGGTAFPGRKFHSVASRKPGRRDRRAGHGLLRTAPARQPRQGRALCLPSIRSAGRPAHRRPFRDQPGAARNAPARARRGKTCRAVLLARGNRSRRRTRRRKRDSMGRRSDRGLFPPDPGFREDSARRRRDAASRLRRPERPSFSIDRALPRRAR